MNFAFIGQFADTVRDTVFTTEYSVRTAMEAVYTLLEVDRGVPEVFASCYDVRALLDATAKMLDGRKLSDVKLPLPASIAEKGSAPKGIGYSHRGSASTLQADIARAAPGPLTVSFTTKYDQKAPSGAFLSDYGPPQNRRAATF